MCGGEGAVQGTSSVLFAAGLVIGPAAFLMILLGLQRLLAPSRPDDVKQSAFECGIPQADIPWKPFNVRFAGIAALFVLFDVESVMLFAVAPKVKGSVAGVLEVAAFVVMLAIGLVYAWRKGLLSWLR
ncbi:NADH:ubiquinone oxidoreductase subunit 3 (chain A) [Coriobacteriaceae bacterium EMTCatB1]|nr:NADH:ubiquinone oxidoreductase subunit 3 (chain A) [Coriobacteriaceae bacterium EMTCatB1]